MPQSYSLRVQESWQSQRIVINSIRDAPQHKIRNGERCGKVRFGYDLAEDGKMLVPNDGEQEAIRLMESLHGAGQSLRAIAGELNSRGVETKEGRPWNHTTVRRNLARAA